MNSASRIICYALYVLPLVLMIVSVSPRMSFGETNDVPTVADSLLVVATTSATTTPEIATTMATTTSTEENSFFPLSQLATSAREVLGASAVDHDEDGVNEGSNMEPIVSAPALPPLTQREFKKHIRIDTHALHSCEAETFRIDITGKSEATARIDKK